MKMKWHDKAKLVKELLSYLEDNIIYACKGEVKPSYDFRFEQGLEDILERYYETGSKN